MLNELNGLRHYASAGFDAYVSLSTPEHDEGAEHEHESGDQVGEPEANVFFGCDIVLACRF